MDAAGSVGGAVLASGGIAAPFAGANAIGKATALVSEWYKASIQANSSRGSFNNGGVLAAAQKGENVARTNTLKWLTTFLHVTDMLRKN